MNYVARILLLAATLTGCATRPAHDQIEIKLATLNDLHGYLEASTFEERKAGGIDALAATLQAWRKDDPDLLLVGAGDMIGASPALSAMFADEPTIQALNLLGMRATSVGNHEFDGGRVELLRQVKGGCANSPRPEKACRLNPSWEGATFSYLAANVIDTRTGQPLLPAYRIDEVKGVKVAFIGTVLKDAPELVAAAGITGLQFIDEAQAVNRLLPELRAQGATVFVVLIHQGGNSKARYDQQYCDDLGGDIADVVKRLDPAVRVVVSGHSHNGYLCRVDGRLVTQAEKFGHMLTRISLVVDRQSGQVVDASARNVVVERGKYPAVAEVDALVASVRARGNAELNKPVAKLDVPSVSRTLLPDSDESPLGQLVADAVLSTSRNWGAQIAFTNAGGIRTSLEAGEGNVVSAAQTQAVLPFGNEIIVMDMTGAQIATLLEQQWDGNEPEKRGLLQVSEGFAYSWDTRKPKGERIVRGSIRLNGVPVENGTSYRVAVFNFLAEGNDGFVTFRQGSKREATGVRDVDALRRYLVRLEQEKRAVGSYGAVPRIIRIK